MKTNEHRTTGCSTGNPCMDIPAGYCDRGFTIVELIVVVAILAALALFAFPAYNKYVDMAKIAKTKSDIRLIEGEINAYILDKNALPNGLVDIQRDNFLDAWKRPYEYRPVATAGADLRIGHFGIPLNTDFDLYSKGSDGSSDPLLSDPTSQDDVVRATDGGYVGTGADF